MSAGADWAAGTAARRERSTEESQSPGSLVITEIPLGSTESPRWVRTLLLLGKMESWQLRQSGTRPS